MDTVTDRESSNDVPAAPDDNGHAEPPTPPAPSRPAPPPAPPRRTCRRHRRTRHRLRRRGSVSSPGWGRRQNRIRLQRIPVRPLARLGRRTITVSRARRPRETTREAERPPTSNGRPHLPMRNRRRSAASPNGRGSGSRTAGQPKGGQYAAAPGDGRTGPPPGERPTGEPPGAPGEERHGRGQDSERPPVGGQPGPPPGERPPGAPARSATAAGRRASAHRWVASPARHPVNGPGKPRCSRAATSARHRYATPSRAGYPHAKGRRPGPGAPRRPTRAAAVGRSCSAR